MRTMYHTGKLAQVTAKMRRYNFNILVISESRSARSGMFYGSYMASHREQENSEKNSKAMDTRSEKLKERYRQQYREADQIKRMSRANKRASMEDLRVKQVIKLNER